MSARGMCIMMNGRRSLYRIARLAIVAATCVTTYIGASRLEAQSTQATARSVYAKNLDSDTVASDLPATVSQLWGISGELWSPTSRLPDFSYAGYRRGEVALPTDLDLANRPSRSVKEFGAVGDGVADDTHAFTTALRDSPGRVVEVPPGEYLITKPLSIDQSRTVLLGHGATQSRLRFTIPLNDIEPNWGATTSGQRTSNYSWSGGFVTLKGQLDSRPLCQVTYPSQRGNSTLAVSSLEFLRVGDYVRLHMSDEPSQSLARFLYQEDPGPIENLHARASATWAAAIVSLNNDTQTITLDRPLTTDVRLEWQPMLYQAASSVEESGIQGLSFYFPNEPYAGHFTELGFNAIALTGVRNCWIRDIVIHNCDSGIFVSGSQNTLQDIAFTSERLEERSRQATGHHGITLRGQDNLLADFAFQTRFMHDITVSRGSSGNVTMRGRGVDLCFDHHRYAPHSNLFTDIDLGLGSRMFQSGGGSALGKHSAAWTTFWGIRSRQNVSWPNGWSPDQINLVGIQTEASAILERAGRWLEPIKPAILKPTNLYEAQLHRRLLVTK
ncbi:MAG: hypothetical protein KDB03_12415 [Planctomycetales bacterium]|nr:hypothetical protein [Planctomycetales bacterium]